jgi:hypothetical protein
MAHHTDIDIIIRSSSKQLAQTFSFFETLKGGEMELVLSPIRAILAEILSILRIPAVTTIVARICYLLDPL